MDMQLEQQALIIPARYCGPPGTVNGGYIAGLMARHMDVGVEVTLHRPTPLDVPVILTRPGPREVQLHCGDELIVSARPGEIELEVPEPPTWEEAVLASGHFCGHRHHPFPGCFVCGTERRPADGGLCIYPGPVPGRNYLAATWIPEPTHADASGTVAVEFIWAAIDCPGGISAAGPDFFPILMGRYAVKLVAPVRPGQRYIATGWEISRTGRKHLVGSALHTDSGDLCAYGLSTMIEPRRS